MKAQGLKFVLLELVLSFICVQAVSPTLHQLSECPLWYHSYDSSTQNCTCLPDWLIHCDHEGNAFLDFGHLLSYDEGKKVLSRTIPKNLQLPWKYNITNAGEVLLPTDLSRLNDYMCAPLNRKGYMCSECIEGFGPSMVSSYTGNLMCCDCSKASGWYGVVLYLSMEFIPLTIFYLLILVFRIRAITSAAMISFIMYCQLLIIAFQDSADSDTPLNLVKYSENVTLRPTSKVFVTLYGVFNLQFFYFAVDPFCVSSRLKSLHIALLGYASAFYPFLLTALIWISFELHDRNFKLLVVLWKPFGRCFARLSRNWSKKSDITDVFAAFFVLSYTKIMYQTLLTLSSDEINNYSLAFKHVPHSSYVLNADSSVTVGSSKYICIVICVVLLFCVFNIFPVVLLALYPFQWFRSALSKCTLNKIAINCAINHFVEKFHHSYRDGLDGGRDMRSFSGLHLLLRIMIIIPVLLLKSIFRLEEWFLRGIVLTIAALLVALCRPYKQMCTNILDSLLLFYLAVFCHLLSSNQDCQVLYFVPMMQVLILAPFVILIIVILIMLIRGVYRSKRSQESLLTSNSQPSQLIRPIATYGTIDN